MLYLVQGILMLSLGTLLTWERTIYTFCLKINVDSGPPVRFLGPPFPDPQMLFTASYLGVIVASFPLISAFAHFMTAYPKSKGYVENLKKEMDPYRWYEYARANHNMHNSAESEIWLKRFSPTRTS